MLLVSEPILGQEEAAAVADVITSGWISMGRRVREFERVFADLHAATDAVAVSSCTAGLHLALLALGVRPGDEVLVPSLTFAATANAVRYVGATPVFVDIVSSSTPHLCLADAASKCGPRTKAVLVMHYGGYLVDPAWRAFADERGLLLIEDAAHATGAAGAGAIGDATVFSFYGNKNMTTGEGGMVLARDPAVLEAVRTLRSHGMTVSTIDRQQRPELPYDVAALGYNYRMDEVRAAIGLVQIAHLPAWNARRRQLTDVYRRELDRAGLIGTLPFDSSWPSAYHILPLVLPRGLDRAGIAEALRANGVQTSGHYPPVHRFSLYASLCPDVRLPRTEDFARRELTLPLHPKLDDTDVRTVVAGLAAALRDAATISPYQGGAPSDEHRACVAR